MCIFSFHTLGSTLWPAPASRVHLGDQTARTHYSQCERTLSAGLHLSFPPSLHSIFVGPTGVLRVWACVLCIVLTHYIQGVGVVDGSKLILHQTGVVSLVRRHHAFHDQGPVLATHLGTRSRGFLLWVDGQTHVINTQIQRNAGATNRHKELALNEKDDRGDFVGRVKDESWCSVLENNIEADDRLIPPEWLYNMRIFALLLQTMSASGKNTEVGLFVFSRFLEFKMDLDTIFTKVKINWQIHLVDSHILPFNSSVS